MPPTREALDGVRACRLVIALLLWHETGVFGILSPLIDDVSSWESAAGPSEGESIHGVALAYLQQARASEEMDTLIEEEKSAQPGLWRRAERFSSRAATHDTPVASGIGAARSRMPTHCLESAEPGPNPWSITANDLWSIHDMILIGYDGVFMKRDSPGWLDVRASAVDLVEMLSELHPLQKCRDQLLRALQQPHHNTDKIAEAARVSLECLPGNFTPDDFSVLFDKSHLGNKSAAEAAKFPELSDEAVSRLGTCKTSRWPRACSYWSSMHLMAYRAEALSMGKRFLKSMVRLISGGALLCGGCTKHFRLLHKDLLGEGFMRDTCKDF
eukprot:TRINITY_DN29895_c0_g1_i1.p1 TRINITY_DN29895_c0_g1~~TRINITY_DN29895_c0_g1_i1.p1  ORF type:complete len:328 (-),score=78.22 TRINITY_DN29895_c0_g1_i1:742-1725(-)